NSLRKCQIIYNCFQLAAQITVGIQVSNDILSNFKIIIFNVDQADLLQQVIIKRLTFCKQTFIIEFLIIGRIVTGTGLIAGFIINKILIYIKISINTAVSFIFILSSPLFLAVIIFIPSFTCCVFFQFAFQLFLK